MPFLMIFARTLASSAAPLLQLADQEKCPEMPGNAQKWPKMTNICPTYAQEPAGVLLEKVDFHRFLDHFKSQFGSFPLFLASKNDQKWPKMAVKLIKMTQNMYKNPQRSYLKTSIFGDFSTFYDPFQSFSGSGAFLGGWLKRKNWRKLTKNDKKCQKKYPTCPDSPEQLV